MKGDGFGLRLQRSVPIPPSMAAGAYFTMSKLVEIGNYTENGYASVIKFGGWRAAYLNNTTGEVSYPAYFERHTQSAELFVLVEGNCKLLASPDGKRDYEVLDMEPLVMYNVPPTSFHAVAMQPGYRILIVENIDVSAENSEYYHMTEDEKAHIREIAR